MPSFAQPVWLLLLLAAPVLALLRFRMGPAEGRFKRVAGTALRCLALGALVTALAGPLKGSHARHTDVMFALDVSTSIDRKTDDEALRFVNRALEAAGPEVRSGLVVFGADAAVEALLRPETGPVADITVDVPRGGTNIARALEVAMGAFPSGGSKRLVLLSDGRENLGRARSAAAVARALGVEVFTVPLERAVAGNEVFVQNIAAPARVRVQEPFAVQLTIHSHRSTRAHVAILRNGSFLRETELDLEPGMNVFSFVQQAAETGLIEYEAVVNADQDNMQENNRYQTFVRVRGAPRVLHAVGQEGWGRYVTEALRVQGLTVEEVPGTALPATRHRLLDYDLIILNNVSGFDLSLTKMELLEEYVRDAGGGLIKLGGDQSYSAGGYYGTPVERLLPVAMDVKTDVKIPSLAVAIVIDKSGSMSTTSRGEEKIEIAKSAAFAAIELLNPFDRVGVLAFDAEYEWSVPLTEAGNRRPIAAKLGTLDAGGGTDLFSALGEGFRALREEDAKVRHLIILSDGLSDTEVDFDGLTRRIAQEGITISTVAFGHDANRPLMRQIADLGKGRFYFTEDPQNIPRIFTAETIVVSRGVIVEEDLRPSLRYPGEVIEGFAPDSFPSLGGYLLTFAKPSAQVLLSVREEDPLLVSWRYGLGKTIAFTSDLAGRWGRAWVTWPEFSRFVAQMARWAMRRRGDESFLPTFRWAEGRGHLLLDVLDRDDRFVNGLELQATLVDPDRKTASFALEQIAPGRYQAEFDVRRSGRYYLNVSGSAAGVRVGPETFGLAVPYSPEYLDLGVDFDLLRDVATMTGGRLLSLSDESLATVTAAEPRRIPDRWRVWRPFLWAALVLLVLEVAVRKLVLPESWQLAWRARRGRRQRVVAAEPGYEALQAAMAETRRKHLESLHEGIYHYQPDDPAARARLYLAGMKRKGNG